MESNPQHSEQLNRCRWRRAHLTKRPPLNCACTSLWVSITRATPRSWPVRVEEYKLCLEISLNCVVRSKVFNKLQVSFWISFCRFHTKKNFLKICPWNDVRDGDSENIWKGDIQQQTFISVFILLVLFYCRPKWPLRTDPEIISKASECKQCHHSSTNVQNYKCDFFILIPPITCKIPASNVWPWKWRSTLRSIKTGLKPFDRQNVSQQWRFFFFDFKLSSNKRKNREGNENMRTCKYRNRLRLWQKYAESTLKRKPNSATTKFTITQRILTRCLHQWRIAR